MNTFDLLLTDIDGTLVDTREFIVTTFQYVVRKHTGKKPHENQIISLMGRPAKEVLSRLTGLSDVQLLFQSLSKVQEENLHLISHFPGTRETLEKLRKKGIKIAGVTSRSHNTGLILETIGIHHLFDLVITADDVKKHKPHPEGIHKALAYFRTPASRAIMMGDTINDIVAGKEAGTKTIGVTYGLLGSKISEHNPDFVIDSITEAFAIVAGK
ncbi:MAG TPA: HAD-IA family hydrolase [Candidatus Saccharimonadales bacterium]|nr:HAD-IA family hydrolase [Candidatus Saccharimonadales bacterium]